MKWQFLCAGIVFAVCMLGCKSKSRLDLEARGKAIGSKSSFEMSDFFDEIRRYNAVSGDALYVIDGYGYRCINLCEIKRDACKSNKSLACTYLDLACKSSSRHAFKFDEMEMSWREFLRKLDAHNPSDQVLAQKAGIWISGCAIMKEQAGCMWDPRLCSYDGIVSMDEWKCDKISK